MIKVPVVPAVLMLMLSLSDGAMAQVKNVNVQVSINDAQDGLDVDTPSACQNKPNENGCTVADQGRRMRINAHLVGNRQCSYDDNGRPGRGQWNLHIAHLGGKNSDTKPNAWGNLDAEVLADFDADPISGLILPEQQTNNRITFFDRNQGEYDIWWKISARCVDRGIPHGREIITDPRVRNRGGG